MKTKIKRHYRSAVSILLSVCMLISCMTVGLIATDAARVDSEKAVGAKANGETVGYSGTSYVKGSWDSWATPDGGGKGHVITGDGYTVTLAASKTYEFCFTTADNGDVFKKDMTITSGVDDYDFSSTATANAKLKTTIAGNYTFKFKSYTSDGIRVKITYPTAAPVDDTWTVVGSATNSETGGATDALFGKSWDPSRTANDMTETSSGSGVYTWTKNNVTLTNDGILFKVVKNHAWDNAYPSNNQSQTVSTAGTYNVTVEYNKNTPSLTMTLTPVANSRLSVQSDIANARVTATYNGTTVEEGGHIDDIPAGATVSVSVTPDKGYKCTGITSSEGGTVSGALYSFTLTMPAANTTVNANITTVTLKKVYFSNSVTGYGQVYAYVYKLSGTTVTDEYLGKYPGTTMTKGDNSNIWYIEVPEDETHIIFVSGEGYSTGQLTIPWSNYHDKPKYYPGMDREHPADGGAWQEYYPRTNEYDVTNGSTMSAPNLFTGITATLYDYFVDDEVSGGWLTGLASYATNYDNTGKTYNDPYKTKLNKSLSDYADATNMPTYDITYPLYFGNLNYKNNTDQESSYYHFNGKVNNSNYLGANYNALTGLSGTKLAGSTIHHYNNGNGVANQNGAPMAMFDEDFLSGENSQNATLATILRTASFPVRKESQTTITVDPSSCSTWANDGRKIYAHFYVDSTNWERVAGYYKDGLWTYSVPSGYSKVKFYRATSIDGTWDNEVDAGAWPTDKQKYKIDSNFNTAGSWQTQSYGTHDYYEYNSTRGKDNAFITDIDQTNKTAKINYYAGSGNAVKSKEKGTEGFFPFDYNNVISNSYNVDYLYFKPSTNWATNNALTYGYFWGDGKSDIWIKFVSDSETGYLKSEQTIPSGYTGMKFVRLNPAGSKTNPHWDNKWNETGNLTVPSNTNEVLYKVNDSNNGGSWDKDTSKITVPKTNNYADTTNRYAHDQGFGMKLTIPFTLNQGGVNADGTPQTFDFSGDDDLWVFVDDKLVLDLGGAHARTTGSINFKDKTVYADNQEAIASGVDRNGSFADGFNTNQNYVHTMTIYYMERGMYESNLKFGFSFHAIPNQFWIDKKIRTKDIINAGFYADNGQTGKASNKNAAKTESEGRFISNFETSYQDESFTVTHKHSGTTANPTAADATTLASGKNYTIDNDTNTYTTDSTGTYPIKHDLGNAFIGQFTKGQYFNLKESYGANNKYVYTPVFSVWDQANNNKALPTLAGNNTDGYTFHFNPTTTVQSTLENTNIKARFENYMTAHTLTLTKELQNATDTTTDFTVQILFDFDYDGENGFDQYIAYPLYYTVDGQSHHTVNGQSVPYQLSGTGTLTFNAGQVVEIEEIPEKAKIKIVEVLPNDITGYRYDSITLTKGGTTVNPASTVDKGVVFAMGDNDMTATVTNRKPDFGYSIKYNYTPYVSTYSQQSYTVSGVFTESEKTTYLQLDDSGNPEFKSTDLKRTFINTKAPYEDNFQQTLSFADSTIVDDGTGLGWSNDVYTCEITATSTDNHTINARFNLPYAVNESLVPQESGETGKVAKITAAEQGSKDIDCFDWYVTAGKSKKNKEGTDPVFVKAPLIIYTDVNDETTKQYFRYWQVSTQSSYGMTSTAYTRCYDYEFNFALFTNCIIEPVYGDTWPQANGGNPNPPTTYNMYERYDPELQITGINDTEISIAFLENSRNQYNNGDNGGRSVSTQAADVVYSDFLLNFNYVAGLTKLKDLSENTKKAGLVVETVNYIDYEKDEKNNPIVGAYDTDKDYSKESSFTSNASTQATAITNWLQGGVKPAGCAKSEFDVHGKLDNKNCIQYYYALNNRAFSEANGGQLLNTMQNRYKVFRAYAYIGDVSGSTLTNVHLSAPVYFTIYDAASQGLADNDTRPTT